VSVLPCRGKPPRWSPLSPRPAAKSCLGMAPRAPAEPSRARLIELDWLPAAQPRAGRVRLGSALQGDPLPVRPIPSSPPARRSPSAGALPALAGLHCNTSFHPVNPSSHARAALGQQEFTPPRPSLPGPARAANGQGPMPHGQQRRQGRLRAVMPSSLGVSAPSSSAGTVMEQTW